MSELAWKMSPKFGRPKTRRMLTSVPEEFKMFLQKKIYPVPHNDLQQLDIMVRRTLALWRLCWSNVPDAWKMIDAKFKQALGDNWQQMFESRNGKVTKI